MKRKVLLYVLSLTLLFSLSGCGKEAEVITEEKTEVIVEESATAVQEDTFITQEFEFYTDDENMILYNFPEEYVKNGDNYSLSEDDVTYETLGSRDTVQMAVDTNVEELEDIPESYIYESESGNEYELVNEQVYIEKQGIVPIPVIEEIFYEDMVNRPSVPEKKMISYYDRVAAEDKEIEGTLTSFEETVAGHWESSLEIDGTFMAPIENCHVYELAGVPNVTVARNAASPVWPGYENDILTSMKLGADKFRINGASWNGEQYTQDGYVMRNAYFTGDMFVSSYKATYETTRDAEGYATKVFYRIDAEEVDAPEEDITTVFRIKAVVKYKLVK